jgi:ribosomal protein L30
MKKLKIKQVKSVIGRKPNQRRTIKALGLKRINSVVEHKATPSILGMVRTVSHLIEVEEL